MFSNLKLATKFGMSFGALILISVLLGGVGIINMKNVGKVTQAMEDSNVPSLEFASQIERNWASIMLDIRTYGLTEDQKYLKSSEEKFISVLKDLDEAKILSNKMEIKTLGDSVDVLRKDVSQYKEFVSRTSILLDTAQDCREKFDAASSEYARTFTNYRLICENALQNSINDQNKTKDIAKTISICNNLIDLGATVRASYWISQAKRDAKATESLLAFFSTIETVVNQLKNNSDQEANIKECVAAIASYKSCLSSLIKTTESISSLMGERTIVANAVLKDVKEVSEYGMGSVKTGASNAEKSMTATILTMKICVAIATIIGIALAFLITRSITKPIIEVTKLSTDLAKKNAEMAKVAGAIASGDLTINVSNNNSEKTFASTNDSKDEIGQLSRAFSEMSEHQTKLGEAFQAMSKNLNLTLGEVKNSSEQVAAGAAEISDASQSLSQGSTESAASLEEITSSMSELGSQTKTNAENATQASVLAKTTRTVAETGSGQMAQMVSAMNEINASSQQIAKIIKTIDEIAFQTNLLALNAAVEAARAGRHGKGFAVVADEVRNLAGRSAKAAKETADLIENSGKKVSNGLEVATKTSESFKDIVVNVIKTADLVAEIAAASNEQAQGIGQINQGLGQIDQVTQQNTANAEETASAAEELSSQSALLKETLAKFKIDDGGTVVQAPIKSSLKRLPTVISKPTKNSTIELDDAEFGKF